VYFDDTLDGCRMLDDQCVSVIKGIDNSKTVLRTSTRKRQKVVILAVDELNFEGPLAAMEQRCNKFGITVTGQVQTCLRVLDKDAYSRFQEDSLRRQRDEEWRTGQLPTTKTVVAEVLERMRNHKDPEVATIGNDVLQERYRSTSAQWEEEEDEMDPEERKSYDPESRYEADSDYHEPTITLAEDEFLENELNQGLMQSVHHKTELSILGKRMFEADLAMVDDGDYGESGSSGQQAATAIAVPNDDGALAAAAPNHGGTSRLASNTSILARILMATASFYVAFV